MLASTKKQTKKLLFKVTTSPPPPFPTGCLSDPEVFSRITTAYTHSVTPFNSNLNILKPHANRRSSLLPNNSQNCWMLHTASVCTPCCILVRVVGSCWICLHTNETQTQQHATLLSQQCWELLSPFAPTFWQMGTTQYKIKIRSNFYT